MGGGQGNALTGQFYVINQDPALKAVQSRFPDVDIKAIQDDITIFGDPDDLFDETDDEGQVTKMGALSLLIQELKNAAWSATCQNLRAWGQLQTPAQRGRRGYRSLHLSRPLTALLFKLGALTFATIQLEKTYMSRHFWRLNLRAFVTQSNSHLIVYQPQVVMRIS